MLLHVVQAMRLSGRWGTLLGNVSNSDMDDLIDLEEKIDPVIGYIVPGDKLKLEISSGKWANYTLEVEVSREGITLPQLQKPVNISGMLPRDVPDFIAKAYIEDASWLSPSIRICVTSRSGMYAPYHGPVHGEYWFNSKAIRNDTPEAQRRTKRGEFTTYISAVPTNDPFAVTALLHYLDWIDSNYQKPEFLTREPYEVWEWALKQGHRQAPTSPLTKFLQLQHSIEALAQQAKPDEQHDLREALSRYMAWVDAHLEDPKLSQVDPLEVWGKAYRRVLDDWARKLEQDFLKAAKERKEKVDLAAVDQKLGDAIEFLKHHVWKLPETEIAEDHTTGVGYLIMASEQEGKIRTQIGRLFLHDFVAAMLEPGFTSSTVKEDFSYWLSKHPQLHAQFTLAQEHPYVEHYTVEIYRPAWQNAIEMAVAFIPIVGQIVGAYEVIFNEDMFGNNLNMGPVERSVLGALILLPMAKKVFSVTKGAVTTYEIAKAYPTLTKSEVAAVFRTSSKLRPGSVSAKILGDAAADIFAKKPITDANKIREIEKVLTEIGFTDPAALTSLKARQEARALGGVGTSVAGAPLSAQETIERQIAEEIADFDFQNRGSQPITELGGKPLYAKPRRVVHTWREALDVADLKNIPKDMLAEFEEDWKNYTKGNFKKKEDYIRFRYLKRIDEWPVIESPARMDLGHDKRGAVEQLAGHVLEPIVDSKLPAGSANTREFHMGFKKAIEPDHLPPGTKTTYLNRDGTVSTSGTGTAFSAEFVGDSKFRDVVPTTDQTRGFARLAQYSDQKKLVFYMKWQERFQTAHAVTDAHGLGIVVPAEMVPSLVQSGVRTEAHNVGVTIEVVSNPMWR